MRPPLTIVLANVAADFAEKLAHPHLADDVSKALWLVRLYYGCWQEADFT